MEVDSAVGPYSQGWCLYVLFCVLNLCHLICCFTFLAFLIHLIFDSIK